jgi:UDP-N-acetylglucosamine 1-carboxyvinyltransferase
MDKTSFAIVGLGSKKTLNGKIRVNGAKNAVLPVMASSILFKNPIRIENVPDIEDVKRMSELLEDLGAKVSVGPGKLNIDSRDVFQSALNAEISKRLRASIILSGPLLGRIGKISFPHPGGCLLGNRPIDIFIDGFKKMGAKVKEVDGHYELSTKNKRLSGAEIIFKLQSCTATEAFLMAAILATGTTVLRNAALEPEIASLAEFLVAGGARIKGIGTTTLIIEGGLPLTAPPRPFITIPDRIEAGSLLILGALAGNNIEITNCVPEHLAILVELLKESGVPIKTGKNWIKIQNNGGIRNDRLKSFDVKTHEYPGFPTDLQAPITVFLTQVRGESTVFETIFDGRLNYTADLVKMGANIKMWDAHRVSVSGPAKLKGRELVGPDIRAGLAFVIAALTAHGKSVISNAYYIDRGYERIEERLRTIGADIKRISTS